MILSRPASLSYHSHQQDHHYLSAGMAVQPGTEIAVTSYRRACRHRHHRCPQLNADISTQPAPFVPLNHSLTRCMMTEHRLAIDCPTKASPYNPM